VQPSDYFPHVDLLLQSMRIDRNRLNGRGKVAIDAPVLRRLLQQAVAHLPFSAEFYADTYPDIAAASAAGQIADLHRHFVETGYFEGRLGAPPPLDDAFYLATYADVAEAVADGQVSSPADHYRRSGAAEGRAPSPALAEEVGRWMGLLRMPVVGGP
jgi:hypothetical protein